jgi:hypothetical protein
MKLFSHTYFVFHSLHLHVSLTPVTILRVYYSWNTRSLHNMRDKHPPKLLSTDLSEVHLQKHYKIFKDFQ